ncbi:MAG: hypothetical protein COV46_05810 [Deltaproteobacteria bacterium CG11_big_fil_rev_8_21_14_0_20_49_13]|nr:MAG: hypothetical protein COV46_05810 [Deltaproteobacteria bacterium CG11_big_fil_rev_8_21_14_0_20_49_13]
MASLKTRANWKQGLLCNTGFESVKDIDVTTKGALDEYKGAWSPVHMLVSAVETCFMVTFLSIAERAHVGIRAFESETEGEITTPDGKHSAITSITIRPNVQLLNKSDRTKLQGLYEKAEQYCVVRNSLNFKVKILAV